MKLAVAALLGFVSAEQVRDLPTCIADVEALIPEVEKIIADFKAGNESQALSDLLALVPDAEKAYTDCTASDDKNHKFMKAIKRAQKMNVDNIRDLPTCISDIEALIPGVEKIIADFKAGNESQALSDLLALVPDAEKAYTDCTSTKIDKKLRDLPTCIADVEALIPSVEKIIADFKAGNEA